MNGILIDTNIYSEAMRGNAAVVDTLRRVPHIGFSSISVGELLSGFKSGNREQKNRRELVAFLDSPRVMLYPVVEDTAEQYSSVQHHLRKKAPRFLPMTSGLLRSPSNTVYRFTQWINILSRLTD
ncbi:MAG: hypothetical protein QTN59_10580 [Candidatus Electrothrix communis]|nr:MAG: hypothetical protein QTN59_10580 [Candidatus Electrothrix communis]